MPTALFNIIRQNWEESERGWGVRPDGFSLHLDLDHLTQYVRDYWDAMPAGVPDEYSRPSGEPVGVAVDQKTYDAVAAAGGSLRMP